MPSTRTPGNLSVADHDVAGERRGRRLKVAAGLAVALLVLVAGAAGAWYLTPPPMPTTIAEADALVASPRFHRLSKDQREPYLDVIREQFGSLDPKQRRAMRGSEAARAARSRERDERMAAFSVMTYEERQAMESPWGGRGGRGSGGGGGPGGPRPEGGADRGDRGDRGPSRDRLSDRMQNGNAQTMANIGEMVNQMRERRD